ncbi:thioredoxin-like protein AAED1 [Pyrus ussuriensis x Pyrus communis]|uniref:Thioredoxin-like protein AAED1 n=1 Tax=Pyrus ussuriensis x Pyrus communis TaxID=2448454 RepID=A0A5N5GUW4_9ROSA|nr:thioredoxin-like protein AAED1 [Pyrus ussuriensis x Pyrus communis]
MTKRANPTSEQIILILSKITSIQIPVRSISSLDAMWRMIPSEFLEGQACVVHPHLIKRQKVASKLKQLHAPNVAAVEATAIIVESDLNENISNLLAFYGLLCSWELAASLKENNARFDSSGVKLIAAGVGTPDKVCILAERAKVFSRFEALQKALKNCTIEATPDDRSSVEGCLSSKVAWKDEGTGDHAPLDDVFDVRRKV